MSEKKYYIKYGDKEFEASEYQEKIFEAIEYGVGNMVVNASAGSSKTSTVVNGVRYIPIDKRVLFVAFNKDIADKIKEIVNRENTNVHTFHSLGRAILIENNIITNKTEINEYKYDTYVKNNINSLTQYKETKTLGFMYGSYISNIIKLVEYARYFHYMQENKLKKLVKMYGIVLVRDEINVVIEVLKWGQKYLNEIDYTDMIWLPVQLNLTTKTKLFDFIFIDEAQDTSIVEQKLIFKTFKRGARFCTVGDEEQQINIWCGASEDAIENFLNQPNTKTYNLPISYRCPKKIIELASNFSDNIIPAPNAIEGEINYDVSPNYAQSGDMILCRTTAPLIKQHLSYLRNNKKSFIRGSENIKEDYLTVIKATNSKYIDKNFLTCDGLIPKLYEMMLKHAEYLKKQFCLTDDEVVIHPSILIMYDNIQGIIALSEGINTVDELIEKIKIIFNGDNTDAIQLSTIHKAKGLEADNVFILYPSLLPSPIARLEWEIKTEKNLQYVAYTRAKKTLNFIREEKSGQWEKFKNQFSVNSMKDTFNSIKLKLNYNTEFEIKEENVSSFKKEPLQKIGNVTRQSYNNININNSKKKGGLKFENLM